MVQPLKKAPKKSAVLKEEPTEEKKKPRSKKATEEKKESPKTEAVLRRSVEAVNPALDRVVLPSTAKTDIDTTAALQQDHKTSKGGVKPAEKKPRKPDRYFEAVGRRKTSVARTRLFTRAGDFAVNDKLHTVYFPTEELQKTAEDSLRKMKLLGRFRISVKVSGGGVHSQAEAIRHGLARCLVKFNPDFRKRLKRAGFLKRDPRMKERKKFGLKKARKAPQWAKR